MEFEQHYKVTPFGPSKHLPSGVKIFYSDGIEEISEVLFGQIERGYFFLVEPNAGEPWIAQFCVDGMEDPSFYQVIACPNPHQTLFSVAWNVFVGDVRDPFSFKGVEVYPVEQITSFPDNGAIFVAGVHDLACIKANGIDWHVEDLGMSELFVRGCTETTVFGDGGEWSERANIDCDFEVEISTGKIIKGLPLNTSGLPRRAESIVEENAKVGPALERNLIESQVNKSSSTMAVYKPRDIAILVSLGWVLLAVLVLTGLCKPHQLLYREALQYEVFVFVFQTIGLLCLRSQKRRKLGFQLLSIATMIGVIYPFTMLSWIQSKP